MPEGCEVRVVADAVAKGIGNIFETAEIIENVPGVLHRYSRELPKNWNVIVNQRWQLKKVRTRGKLILLDIEIYETKEPWVLLSTLGMSGDWRFNASGEKHTRFAFLKANGDDLSYYDPRCFGTIRVAKPKDAKTCENKIGWDLLQSPMDKTKWIQLQSSNKIENEEIKVALMRQDVTSGPGNIYSCEILHEVGVHPKQLVSKIDPTKWFDINIIAHSILQKAYKLGGSSIKDFTADGHTGNAQTMLKIYGKKLCPNGHKIETIQQDGRTTWFCPVEQKLS